MTFFQHQIQAKRQTNYLIGLFLLTIVGIALSIHLLVSLALTLLKHQSDSSMSLTPDILPEVTNSFLNVELLLITSGITLAIIAAGSIFKILLLRGGGATVATALGGQLIHPDSQEPHLRLILNVVEEMAIASGTPVPPVYLIPERGINAFAAGYSADKAVIGITRGALDILTRDELQGVIAHEFSHILNGDMRLNIRLMGLLQGLLLIAIIGRILVHSGSRSGRAAVRTSRQNKGDGGFVLILGGLSLLIIGWIGVLGGRLIKAAVSRQREFLADASAVQFTRNPNGISGALKKIGGYLYGSAFNHPKAEESSHMFFGSGFRNSWFPLLATHPPLEERIRRIDPSFKGTFNPVTHENMRSETSTQSETTSSFIGNPTGSAPSASSIPSQSFSIGEPTALHLQEAKNILSLIPATLHELAHSHAGAEAVILILLLSKEPNIREKQIKILETSNTPPLEVLFRKALPLFDEQNISNEQYALGLLDICLGTLATLEPTQRSKFIALTREFVLADGQVSLFEYMLHKTFLKHFSISKSPSRSLTQNQFQVASYELLSVVAGLSKIGSSSETFERAVRILQEEIPVRPMEPKGGVLESVDKALSDLSSASLQQKERLLKSLESIIMADETVSRSEAEIFRAIAATLDIPVSPLLPSTAG